MTGPAYAKLRIHASDGREVMAVSYSKPFLRIGRSDAPHVSEDAQEDDPVIQNLHLPGLFAGVSREHAEICWSESQGAFALKVVGRNGCIVNKRKYNQSETALLPVNSISTFSLGKNCFIYFASARYVKVPRTPTEPVAAPGEEIVDWQNYVVKIFKTIGVDTLSFNLIQNSLSSSNPDLFEINEVARKRNLKNALRKQPFRTDPANMVHYKDPSASMQITSVGVE